MNKQWVKQLVNDTVQKEVRDAEDRIILKLIERVEARIDLMLNAKKVDGSELPVYPLEARIFGNAVTYSNDRLSEFSKNIVRCAHCGVLTQMNQLHICRGDLQSIANDGVSTNLSRRREIVFDAVVTYEPPDEIFSTDRITPSGLAKYLESQGGLPEVKPKSLAAVVFNALVELHKSGRIKRRAIEMKVCTNGKSIQTRASWAYWKAAP